MGSKISALQIYFLGNKIIGLFLKGLVLDYTARIRLISINEKDNRHSMFTFVLDLSIDKLMLSGYS